MDKKKKLRQFGMFSGVFVPTFLTIIGVIFYLRLGLVVGSAGIIGALLIVVLAVSVTIATALSLSVLITDIKIGTGGAYSIISQTLGRETGGSIGIFLYFAQALSVAFYIFGFSEGWKFIFPNHSQILVIMSVFFSLLLLTILSTRIAIKFQYVVFGFIILSLFSIFLGGGFWLTKENLVHSLGNFDQLSFWALFALFFPAVTGIMAGIGLSGELTNPKKQIPVGTLMAVGVSTIIYIALIFWFGKLASANQLVNNSEIIISLSYFGPLVILGLLAASYSSALVTLISAPRILEGLGMKTVIPFSGFFSKRNKVGEPLNSYLFTYVIVFGALFIGSLNTIAPLLTVFFLITYAMLNLIVFIQQFIGFSSFRPTFKMPIMVPLYGALSSIFIILLINMIWGIVAILSFSFIYWMLLRKNMTPQKGDIRSGIYVYLAEWAAKKAKRFTRTESASWKPQILFPVKEHERLVKTLPVLLDITKPNGNLDILGLDLKTNKLLTVEIKDEFKKMSDLIKSYGKKNIFSSFSTIKGKNYAEAIQNAVSSMKDKPSFPNILFIPFNLNKLKKEETRKIIKIAKEMKIGVISFDLNKKLKKKMNINILIPNDVLNSDFKKDRIFDLSLLIAYRLSQNWKSNIYLNMIIDKSKYGVSKKYLEKLIEESRLTNAKIKFIIKRKKSKLSYFGKGLEIIPFNLDNLEKVKKSKLKGNLKMFVCDSTRENILS